METAVKRLYEGLFLVDSAQAAAQWDATMGAIQKVLDRAEADVVSLRKWDERRLAYEIQGCSRGTYILAYFRCDPSRIGGIERDVQLSEQILRVLILRTDRMSQEDMDKPTPAELHPESGVSEEASQDEEEAEEISSDESEALSEDTEASSEEESEGSPEDEVV